MENKDLVTGIIIPAFIAAIGFTVKAIYDLIMEDRRRNIQRYEDKLKHFYWPLLVRLEKDNAVWELLLNKRGDSNLPDFKIAQEIEKEILDNHKKILELIESYFYLAEADKELVDLIKKYIRNTTIYEAIRRSGDETTFPYNLNKEWKYPDDLYKLIEARTRFYQSKLNKLVNVKNLYNNALNYSYAVKADSQAGL